MFYYLHFAFGDLRYWEINRFARGYTANLQQSTNADQVSQIVPLHWMYPSMCQGTLKHQRSLVMWLFSWIKKKTDLAWASYIVSESTEVHLFTWKLKQGLALLLEYPRFFQLSSAFNPNWLIPFHWQNLLRLFTDKDFTYYHLKSDTASYLPWA